MIEKIILSLLCFVLFLMNLTVILVLLILISWQNIVNQILMLLFQVMVRTNYLPGILLF